VIETFLGKDGVIRVMRLVTESGQLVRPIQKLYSLEVDTVPGTLHTLYKKRIRTTSDSNKDKRKLSHAKVIEQKVDSVPFKTRSGRIVKPIIK